MSNGLQNRSATLFVLIAVTREAPYWTPQTVAQELCRRELLSAPTEEALATFRDEVIQGLVGRAAEKFWANDAVTAAKAAAIRAAAQALHELTIDVLEETATALKTGGS